MLIVKILRYLFELLDSESEGSCQYGNYRREADDLRAVVQFFKAQKRVVAAIIGHSKGLPLVLFKETLILNNQWPRILLIFYREIWSIENPKMEMANETINLKCMDYIESYLLVGGEADVERYNKLYKIGFFLLRTTPIPI